MSGSINPRNKLIKQLKLMLGDQMVDIELDNEHYDLAVDLAVERLRQRSDGALEERDLFITLQPEQTEYTLPDEVQQVRRLYRRGVGANTTGGTNFDPFEAAFSNIYLLQAGRTGGLATWDFFSQYQESIGRVFGSQINFTWEPNSHKLTIVRKVKAEEDVLVRAQVKKTDDIIILDSYTGPWVRSFALAHCKIMLGEARSKYPSGLPGPNGAVILNGEAIKQEGLADLEVLEQEVQNLVTSDSGYAFIIG